MTKGLLLNYNILTQFFYIIMQREIHRQWFIKIKQRIQFEIFVVGVRIRVLAKFGSWALYCESLNDFLDDNKKPFFCFSTFGVILPL